MSAISYQRSAISKIHVNTIPPQAGLNAESSIYLTPSPLRGEEIFAELSA
jgi:hypothetical protein